MDTKPTVEEIVSSLNGYDEIDIEKQFGAEIGELLELHTNRGLRSLVYIQHRRRGLDAKAAKDEAMKLTLKQLNEDTFSEEDEPIPSDPITESGKDSSVPVDEPKSSPTGAPSPASPPAPTTT